MDLFGKRILLSIVVLLSATAGAVSAGELQPGASPASTMKTLNQVEARTLIRDSDLPLTISTSGSYYLGENLSWDQTTGTAIILAASDVTLDLNGFTLSGRGPTSSINNHGIAISSTVIPQRVTVQHGTVRDFGGGGVLLDQGSLVRDLRVARIGTIGICCQSQSRVERCTVQSIGNSGRSSPQTLNQGNISLAYFGGIYCGGPVRDCLISDVAIKTGNSCFGIQGSSRISGNTVEFITGNGSEVYGILANPRTSTSDNQVFQLTNTGSGNNVTGIAVWYHSRATANTISTLSVQATNGCVSGISSFSNTHLCDNDISALTGYYAGVTLYGIVTSDSCSINDNSLSGFSVNKDAKVYGICPGNNCVIERNRLSDFSCSSSSPPSPLAVIALSHDYCRLAHNHIADLRQYYGPTAGVLIEGDENTVLSNTFAGGMTYDIEVKYTSKDNYYAGNLYSVFLNDVSHNNTAGTSPAANVNY